MCTYKNAYSLNYNLLIPVYNHRGFSVAADSVLINHCALKTTITHLIDSVS